MSRLISCVVLLLMMGCQSQLPPPADGTIARQALERALENWKAGAQPDMLQQLTQPIHFNDQLWSRGSKLVDYTIEPGELHGQGWNCQVELQLRRPDGQVSRRRVSYQIDTQPIIVIVQQP